MRKPRNRINVHTKFIFITGGVLSSLGKGLAAAAIGALLEARGLRVTFQKLDPYINVDPGTMNPFQHGEVYVTEDGSETDLDLGHYERFTQAQMGSKNNYTSGKIYYSVITKERKGAYLGGTVQIIPHVTDEIKQAILSLAEDNVDVAIIEIGGTVGDIESLPFLEAIRQLGYELGRDNALFIHLTYVPYIKTAGELKTKPTQHSVKELRAIGIQPDILLCRTDRFLPPDIKKKIALFCNVEDDAVITAKDVDCIYEIPLVFHQEGLDKKIVEYLNMWTREPDLSLWENIVNIYKNPEDEVTIAIIGKYVNLKDSYKSLNEALVHGGLGNSLKVNLKFVNSDELTEENVDSFLRDVDGILVPGGFGVRGIEGKLLAIKYAREKGVPFFGICLGMQLSVIDFARNVLGWKEANSTEFDPQTPYPVIYLMKEWYNYRTGKVEIREEGCDLGGTMRLGAYPCKLLKGSKAWEAYQQELVFERHRHRYEFNNQYREALEKAGLKITGTSPDEQLVEIVEIADHPWFVGVQFHPEFKSKPIAPHPLFTSFIKASYEYKKKERR
ncbi:CTP synthase [Thermodesulfobacterium sp. TA1]|uniref:CTP synthase n=1 Tax=Thermodesulfobacterium sp. TA1 TaxID=2234087 RepID=UPI0012325DB7|nr:CTP synthase [Thermodesulfobacterium sp. TA1]QER42438.1 CTP synthase [Thermodesulfobacterium sp. TA1]